MSSYRSMKAGKRPDPFWEAPAQGKGWVKKPALCQHPAVQRMKMLQSSRLPKMFTVSVQAQCSLPPTQVRSHRELLFFSFFFHLLITQQHLNHTNLQLRNAMSHSPPLPVTAEKALSLRVWGSGPSASGLTLQGCHKFLPATPHIVTEPYSKDVVMAIKRQPRAEWILSPHKWCFKSPISSLFPSDKLRH